MSKPWGRGGMPSAWGPMASRLREDETPSFPSSRPHIFPRITLLRPPVHTASALAKLIAFSGGLRAVRSRQAGRGKSQDGPDRRCTVRRRRHVREPSVDDGGVSLLLVRVRTASSRFLREICRISTQSLCNCPRHLSGPFELLDSAKKSSRPRCGRACGYGIETIRNDLPPINRSIRAEVSPLLGTAVNFLDR